MTWITWPDEDFSRVKHKKSDNVFEVCKTVMVKIFAVILTRFQTEKQGKELCAEARGEKRIKLRH